MSEIKASAKKTLTFSPSKRILKMETRINKVETKPMKLTEGYVMEYELPELKHKINIKTQKIINPLKIL